MPRRFFGPGSRRALILDRLRNAKKSASNEDPLPTLKNGSSAANPAPGSPLSPCRPLYMFAPTVERSICRSERFIE
jgi:hypothetical protein